MSKIFALDVGTRNVVLLSAEKTHENKIKIDHVLTREHETRAMEDGQIHDIAKVAEIVEKLKVDMEAIIGQEINEVAVAVAGRSLVTASGSGSKDFSVNYELLEDDIRAVELIAIQDAMDSLKEDSSEYHCVGYSISNHILDGISLKNPLYQKGAKLEVEVLATFLPKIVVDSMYTMVRKAGLEIKTLTLEPIAAINVVIPEDMRKLNIALVDIGAGTSDIAITKGGRIIGFGMVPMAGDEITEKIEQEYLLDFNEAERVKRALCEKSDTVSYEDILGMEMELPKEEVLEKIDDVLEELSSAIATKIMEVNEASPQAIILIGGGSLVSNLKEKIAEKVSLVAGRVAVRGTEAIKNLVDNTESLKTAEAVTPIGIANMAFDKRGFNILEIVINNESHRIFSFNKELSIMEALVATGIGKKGLYSKHGQPLTYTVNNKLHIQKGEAGKIATIKVNGHSNTLDNLVVTGDNIEIIKPRDGRSAKLFGRDIEKLHGSLKVTIDQVEKEYYSKILKDGKIVEEDYKVEDRDSFEIELPCVRDIISLECTRSLKFILDSKEQSVELPLREVYKDEEIVDLDDMVEDGSVYTTKEIEGSLLKVEDIVSLDNESFKVIVNNKIVEFEDIKKYIYINNEVAEKGRVIKNNDVIETRIPEERLPIVSDIFKYYNPDKLLEQNQGMLVIEVNNKKSEFVSKLQNNDVVNLFYR